MNIAKRLRRMMGTSKPRHPGDAVRLTELPESLHDLKYPCVDRTFAVIRVPVREAVPVAAYAGESEPR